MKLQLSNGEAKVKIFFDTVAPANPRQQERRRTNIVLDCTDPKDDVGHTILAQAVCNHNDTFSRSAGRKAAADKLLAMMSDIGYDKADRAIAFRAICPEFSKER